MPRADAWQEWKRAMGYNGNDGNDGNDRNASDAGQIGYDRDDGRAPGRRAVVCPYCRSTDTELFSLFGQQLLTVQYYCNTCRTPFEYVKDDDVLDDYGTRKEDRP